MLAHDLKTICERDGVSVSMLLRQLVEQYVESN